MNDLILVFLIGVLFGALVVAILLSIRVYLNRTDRRIMKEVDEYLKERPLLEDLKSKVQEIVKNNHKDE